MLEAAVRIALENAKARHRWDKKQLAKSAANCQTE
jgi:hypothetical protein